MWLETEAPADSVAPIRRMLLLSFVLHLAALTLLAGVRFTPRVERLQATEVTLVSLPRPQPEAAPVLPAPAPPRPAPPPLPKVAQAEALPQPSPPLHKPATPATRASAPFASPEPVLPVLKNSMTARAPDTRLQDALRGIERPPEAPRLGDYRPAPVPARPVTEPRTPEQPPSLSDLTKQLDGLVQRPPPKPPVALKPKQAARPTKPATTIQVSGDDTGLSRYLAIVQNRISEQWVAPPVDITHRSLKVIVTFRLHRSGRITDVAIERESGNGYYDDAAKRAVLSVGSLPPFPPYVTEDVLETHFSFTVGEEVG